MLSQPGCSKEMGSLWQPRIHILLLFTSTLQLGISSMQVPMFMALNFLGVCGCLSGTGRKVINFNNCCMKIIISGGGIAGLTLALAAKQAGYLPVIIEQRDALDKPSFGGGIGLWPPSQMVMERLGVLDELQKNGKYMPSACYYNSQGYILGHPSPSFRTKFPVLCLQRQQLQKSLSKKCQQQGIQVATSTTINHIQSSPNQVRVHLSNGQQVSGHFLVGADGINSKVRNFIMKERNLSEVRPFHCQYAYFRAVVDVGDERGSQWHGHAFETWGERRRFGYVPLKEPKTFWFVAIPIGEQGLSKISGSHLCSDDQKLWLLKQFQYWQGPINIKKLLQLTPANTILRTDIHKVKDVTSFPWQSQNKNVIILGDAANATAPNLAQGAGLAIESAWDMISMVDMENGEGLKEYLKKRKKRASTVQNLADMVAKIGQLKSPWCKVRDFAMINSTHFFSSVEQRVFEEVVSHSVGGDTSKLHWLPPPSSSPSFLQNIRQQRCILGQILDPEYFSKLPIKTRQFRSSLIGEGKGKVTVTTLPFAHILGLPNNLHNANFGAYCQTFFNKNGNQWQKWTRVFGQGQNGAKKYVTQHRATPNLGLSKTGLILSETIGIRPDIFRFGYIPVIENSQINYKSQGLWLRNYRLPIPHFLLPSSSWQQKQTQNGWTFDGRILLPKILGSFPIMRYSGIFEPTTVSRDIKTNKKRVVIAGGTGMIGADVARAFYLQGWDVEILTRNRNKQSRLPFAKMHEWNPNNYQDQRQIKKLSQILNQADVLINLSGQNPGSSFWTQKIKTKIIESRLNSIKLLTSALKKVDTKAPLYLQASAAGIYGDRKQQILYDDHQPGQGQVFRIRTCKEIESLTRKLWDSAVILRIGHVFCSEGGLLPHLQLASKMRAARFGSGGQYAPWIHIQDLSNSLVHIAHNPQPYLNTTTNISSPTHHTYQQILSKLAETRGRRFCIVPVPQTLLKFALGEISSVLLDSQRMHPKRLMENGFQFRFGELRVALTCRKCL